MEYFRSLDLIEVVSSSDVLARKNESENSQLFATSTPKEWERRARYFLKHRLFRPAATCFDRAGIEEKFYLCLGKICVKEAMENTRNEKEKLREAALYYVQARKLDSAALCLARCGEKIMAATVFEKNEMVSHQINFNHLLLAFASCSLSMPRDYFLQRDDLMMLFGAGKKVTTTKRLVSRSMLTDATRKSLIWYSAIIRL